MSEKTCADMDDSELTIEELIQIHLAMIDSVIDAVGEPVDYCESHRHRVRQLLARLGQGAILPEHAEVEFGKLSDEFDKWFK